MSESTHNSAADVGPAPMISVSGLTKRYGEIRAIENLTFSVARGDVVGLLGPNGAGKTTTMRILCGSLGATQGSAKLDGADISQHPQEAKSRIGYLPESPPLYKTMVVQDYVEFAARIKGVKDPAAATQRVLAQVGLLEQVGDRPASERIIGHLSKGFQQRVGLAQALVHDPEVLILDEPTSGLDPAQRKEIREFLQALAQESKRTIILSTHVLADVEDICDRVIMISRGSVVVQDTIASLRSKSNRVRLLVADPGPEAADALAAVKGAEGVMRGEDGAYSITISEDCRAQLAAAAVPFGLLELGSTRSLEEIYLELTSAVDDASLPGPTETEERT
mgnify:CR=1 FL=1